MHILSAHVWVQGWMADYYLAADHRALDVARQTADMHLRRMWGEHELTGRRLYLAAWNLAEVYDATKDDRYKTDLDDRVARMLRLRAPTASAMELRVRAGLRRALRRDHRERGRETRWCRAARARRAVAEPLDGVVPRVAALSVKYELSGDVVPRHDRRACGLPGTDALPRRLTASWTQATLAHCRRRIMPCARLVSPRDSRPPRPDVTGITHGLRFFSWTTGHGLPWALALARPLRRLRPTTPHSAACPSASPHPHRAWPMTDAGLQPAAAERTPLPVRACSLAPCACLIGGWCEAAGARRQGAQAGSAGRSSQRSRRARRVVS
jgi:hypothetical protein